MIKNDRRLRPALMTSVAMLGVALGSGAAHAETNAPATNPRLDITEVEDVRHGMTAADFAVAEEAVRARQTALSTTLETYVGEITVDRPQIVIGQPGTPTTALDPVNINGIGQMIVATPNPAGGVGLGLCTGSLINPRTVLFAAHCVNTRAATAYGSASGGVAIGFGFNNSNNTTQPGQPAGTSPLLNWLFGSTAQNRAAFTTSTAENFYTVNGLVYNPLSLEPAAQGFLYGDVAIASLDTPARNIPTWALLLSALTPPTTSTPENGTGYHVVLSGYGRNGVGNLGDTGAVDYRRRVAENWLGALTSFNTRDTILFGGFSVNRPQNLYWLDFDDPRRGTAAATTLDFNVFRDNPLPNEGSTAGGDSGGPLILDRTFDRQVVIGVLSGGSRFFGAQPFSSYGTASFYQPLYLYWDWIAANNPYRYVGAVAGNGNWEDPTRWVSLQDPNYFIIGPNGQLVNGTPSLRGEQSLGSSGQFGEICVQGTITAAIGPNQCRNLATGRTVNTTGGVGGRNAPTGDSAGMGDDITNNFGTDTIEGAGEVVANGTLGGTTLTGSEETSFNTALTLPAPTIANGLPGATNFVPNNTAGNRVQGVLPRYFDVTLANSGTTTLSSAVTIDKLTVRGLAGLTIASNGQLTALNDVTQLGGMINVNGRLNSVNDIFILSGMLQGTGTITAPFVNSVAATIAPGTNGTVGTLSVAGNLVLASGTTYLLDVAGADSDRIAVTGRASVGGQVVVGTGIAGQVNGLGRQFTILTATGGVTGTFAAQSLSPILSQQFTYQANAVLMQIRAASYGTVIDGNNPVQRAYAQLFDQNRSNAALAGLYALDFASVDTIRGTFNALAPVNEQAVLSISAQSVNFLQNFNDARLREADRDRAGGKIAITGRPLELAQMSLSPMGQPLGGAVMALQDGAENTEMREANLPDNIAIFLSGGYVTGNVGELPGYNQRRDMEGFYIAGGVEYYPGERTMLGFSGYYSSLDADTPLAQRTESSTYAASIYARHQLEGGVNFDGQFSIGSVGFDTRRTVQFLGATQTLRSSSDDLLISGALGLSYDIVTGIGTISPGIEGRYASVNLETIREDGGTLGLAVARRNFKSTQARFGFDYAKRGEVLTLNATAKMVWEFQNGPNVLAANFAQGVGPFANFTLRSPDQAWGEVGASATFGKGPFTFTAGYDTTIGRQYADAQVVRGTATFRF